MLQTRHVLVVLAVGPQVHGFGVVNGREESAIHELGIHKTRPPPVISIIANLPQEWAQATCTPWMKTLNVSLSYAPVEGLGAQRGSVWNLGCKLLLTGIGL